MAVASKNKSLSYYYYYNKGVWSSSTWDFQQQFVAYYVEVEAEKFEWSSAKEAPIPEMMRQKDYKDSLYTYISSSDDFKTAASIWKLYKDWKLDDDLAAEAKIDNRRYKRYFKPHILRVIQIGTEGALLLVSWVTYWRPIQKVAISYYHKRHLKTFQSGGIVWFQSIFFPPLFES